MQATHKQLASQYAARVESIWKVHYRSLRLVRTLANIQAQTARSPCRAGTFDSVRILGNAMMCARVRACMPRNRSNMAGVWKDEEISKLQSNVPWANPLVSRGWKSS